MSDYTHAVNQAHIGGYNQGKAEGRKDLIIWLFGQCCHPLPLDTDNQGIEHLAYPAHRYECETCMLELEHEKNSNQKNIQEKS